MQYAEIDEVWGSSASNQYKIFEKKHNEQIQKNVYDELIDSSNNIAMNTSIMHPHQNQNAPKIQFKNNEIIPPYESEKINQTLPDINYNNTPIVQHRYRNRRPKYINEYEYDSDDDIKPKKRKITCDDIEAHINKCPKCYNKYVKNTFEKNDFPDIFKSSGINSDVRQSIMLALAGVGIILLLDYLFKHPVTSTQSL